VRIPLVPVRVVLGAAGAATAGLLILGSWHLQQARLDLTLDEARQARRLLPAWPESDRQLALASTYEGKTRRRPDLLAQSLSWRVAATRRDPTDPRLWDDLADSEAAAGMDAQARVHYRRALRHDPWSVRTLNGLATIEERSGSHDEAVRLLRRSLLVAPNQRGARAELTKVEAARP
jgi:Flp pilus assembly protein TadD